MPVEAQTVEYSYLGDGVSTVFGFPSRFLSNDDLFVALNGVIQVAGFTITGAGTDDGGEVTFAVPPGNLVRVMIVRNPSPSQLIDFENGQTILEGTMDNALDKLTMIAQYLLRAANRSVRIGDAVYETGASLFLPSPDTRALKLLSFGPSGEVQLVTPSPGNGGTTTPGGIVGSGQTGRDLIVTATADAARAVLGLDLDGETNVASAAAIDVGGVNTSRVNVTGTTSVTSFVARANKVRLVRFSGALTLTHDPATLILPGAANILTTAGDFGLFASDAAGAWRCLLYYRADGSPLSLGSAVAQPVATVDGGVARPLAVILRNVVSVEDFGAVPDGVTVANTAFANAFAYARANRYKRVIANGDFKLTTSINCAGVNLEGTRAGTNLYFDRSAAGPGQDLVLFDPRLAGAGQYSFGGLRNLTVWAVNGTQRAAGVRGFGDVDDQPDNVVIEDVGLTADTNSWFFNGIAFDGTARTTPQGIRRLFLNRVAMFRTENTGVYIKDVQNAYLDNVNTNQPVDASGVAGAMPTLQGGSIFIDGGGSAGTNSFGAFCRGMYLTGPIILYRCAEIEVTGVVAGYYFDTTSDFVYGKLRNRQATAGGWVNNNLAATSNVQII